MYEGLFNRVDNVSEKTLKLLELFNKDEDVKKKTVLKKRSNFLEKNLSNITLKENEMNDFYDPVFLYILNKSDDYFLLDELDQSLDGKFLYTSSGCRITMNDESIDLHVNYLPICASLT